MSVHHNGDEPDWAALEASEEFRRLRSARRRFGAGRC
jgi:hypothetical protein